MKTVTVSKQFRLGYCRCGCGHPIPIKKKQYKLLQKYKNGHHPTGQYDRTGINNSNWKGGRKKTLHGYIDILVPEHPKADINGYIKEHRYVFEQYYNCCLLTWGDVHHKNGDKTDNRIENLEGMTTNKHAIIHIKKVQNKIDTEKRYCLVCGSQTTDISNRGRPIWHTYKDGYRCGKCFRYSYYRNRPR